MKKQLLLGAALGLSLAVSSAVKANPVIDMPDAVSLQTPGQLGPIQLEKSDSAPSGGAGQNRFANESANDVNARWGWVDPNGKTEIMAFTSSAAAQNAAALMSRNGESLSFTNFGRVPFHQMLTVNSQTPNGSGPATHLPTADLPEPATLTLLGAGLAALATGLRRKNKKSQD